MTYLLNRKQNNKGLKKKIFYIFLFFISIIYLSEVFKSSLINTFAPFYRFSSSLYQGINIVPELFGDKYEAIERIKKLEKENDDFRLKLNDYASVVYENNLLRKELAAKIQGDPIFASVLARPPQIAFDTIIVDRGLDDGVAVGDIVLLSDRTLIGEIYQVFKSYSKVYLYSKPDKKIVVYVARTGEYMEIEGIGGGNFHSSVPIDFDIKVGDIVVEKKGYSYNLAVVGFVEENTPSGLRNVLLTLPVSVLRIDYVNILKSFNEQDNVSLHI